MSYPDPVAQSPVDHLPRTMSGGLALPPRQLPLLPLTTAARPPTAETQNGIVAGILGTVADALDAIRRAAAARGIS